MELFNSSLERDSTCLVLCPHLSAAAASDIDGWAGIVIGGKRWDREPGSSRWVSSAQTRLTQPIPGWVKVTDAHVLGRTTLRGRPVVRIVLRHRDAGLVHRPRGRALAPRRPGAHDDDCAFHARRLLVVQLDARDRPAAVAT